VKSSRHVTGRSSATISAHCFGQRASAATVASAMSAICTSETKSLPSPGRRSFPSAARANQSSSKPVPGP
jgi:hypothetical protein